VVALNLEGAADPGPVPELDATGLAGVLGQGVCVLDIRDPESFDAGHLDGSVNLPAGGRGLGTRAGWAADAEESIVLVSPSLRAGREAVELLRAAGVWNLVGVSVADPSAWRDAGLRVQTAAALSPDHVVPRVRSGALTLIDVRDPAEWSEGHIAGSYPLPLSVLGDGRNGRVALESPIAVVCASGVRAAVAASILRRHGHRPVWRVSGGVEQLVRLGVPVTRAQP